MKEHQALTHYLSEYQPPSFRIPTTQLLVQLYEDGARVTSTLSLTRHPDADPQAALELEGQELLLERLVLDGRELVESEYQVDEERLRIERVPDAFELVVTTWIKPQENTCLEGLYRSGGLFCTQCEAEGFRRITYYADRPDVLSVFTTTVEAEREGFPVLLSNGNPVAQGDTASNRHWVTWEDPFPKPCYLFALVAGNLVWQEDAFTTASGQDVTLRIYVEPENRHKCDHAMDSLKRSMRWDEEVYGREYDLERFNIVAVKDFNMGAMENKGLNVFNAPCVLADPETATDAAYERIEAIVAHEYFHNWSGNRVTCRDWFQLSLKEGFTVFRDAAYTADRYGAAVKRIDDATLMRTAQFAEDAGPMAHPVRPDSYMEISNFYTLTVYEKGAEVVGMLHRLLGKELFRQGSDLYFERHDGQAVTTEDFVACMESVSGRDLSQFKRWYSQAGTPRLTVSDAWDENQGRYRLTVQQSCPATPGQPEKAPFHIPLEVALFKSDGHPVPLDQPVLELRDTETDFVFEGLTERPIPSLLRDFSAPVHVDYDYSIEQLAFLMRHDTDGFCRWDAAQTLMTKVVLEQVDARKAGVEAINVPDILHEAWQSALEGSDHGLVARLIQVPSLAWLAGKLDTICVEPLMAARADVLAQLVHRGRNLLWSTYQRLQASEELDGKNLSPEAMGRRALKNQCLAMLAEQQDPEALDAALAQQEDAYLMTEQQGGLAAILRSGDGERGARALSDYEKRWGDDGLVMENWFSLQAGNSAYANLERVIELTSHPLFSDRNPNKVRSVIGAFANQNWRHFHAEDGSGYRFLQEWIARLNRVNPQIASRLVTPLTRWRRYEEKRGAIMRDCLVRLKEEESLSPDVYEVVSKSLADS